MHSHKLFFFFFLLFLGFNQSGFAQTYAIKVKEYGLADFTIKVKEYGVADETWKIAGTCSGAVSYSNVKIKEYGIADLTVKIKEYGLADKNICIKNPDDLPEWFFEFLE